MGYIQFRTHPRVPQHRASFYPLLVGLANAANDAFANPTESARLVEMAVQATTSALSSRRRDEDATINADKIDLKWKRLQLKFVRENLKLLRGGIFTRTHEPAPLGTAIADLVRCIDIVTRELDRAYETAPMLDDERRALEDANAHKLPDLVIPDSHSDGPPRVIDYDELLTNENK